MFYSLPPAPPALVVVGIAPMQDVAVLAVTDCKRGSRDCFPTDRVGHHPSDDWMRVAEHDPANLGDNLAAR